MSGSRLTHLRLMERTGDGATARALIDEARALDKIGRRAEARALYESALRQLTPESAHLASSLLRWIARSHEVDADYAAAGECADAAVAAAEASGDRNALGHALNILAAVRWRTGDLDAAEQLFHEALERGASTTDPRLQVDVMTNLGSLAKIRGDYREALRRYEEALTQARRHSLLEKIVVALNNLGLAQLELRRLDLAEHSFTEALTIANALGELSVRIELEVNVAALQVEKGDYAEAKRRLDRSMTLAGHLGDARANGEAEKLFGVIARETGDLAGAEAHLVRAAQGAAQHGDLMLEGEASRELGELYLRLGRNRETLQALNRAYACFNQLRSRHELDDVARRTARLEESFLDVVRRWSESIESKDVFTKGHCERVADLASALAVSAGMPENTLFWFRVGALLHDVGKLIVPAEVLNKPGALTDEEWAIVRQHPGAGVKMLADIPFPWDVTPMVRSHHERWDGDGYPDALAGEDIPLAARVLCIAEVYDALVSDRSYKRAFSHLEAMEIMRREAGKQFDPVLFARFEEIVRRGAMHVPPASVPPLRRASGHPVAIGSEEDDLTGALVRRAFVSVTNAVLAERRRSGTVVSLLVVDVDQFKAVNDTHGHLVGDDALQLVAGVIREQLRPGQYLGRYAGDEFIVLLPGLDTEAARGLADEIRRTSAALPIPLREQAGQVLTITLSIGVSTAPMHGDSFEALFTSADRALFEAKREGRDKVVIAGAPTAGPPQLVFGRFVGRARELRALASALDESVAHDPQVRVLIGEAGVGKSTLVRQLLPEARLRDAIMVFGRSLESESRPPYGPWAEIVRGLHEAGLTPPRPWPYLERIVPALRGADESGDAPPLDPRHGHQLLAELAAYLRGASDRRPLALALEDAHWADTASWDALEYVLAQLDDERIWIALTMRSEEASYGAVRERRQRLSRHERAREIRLERLSTGEVREWLQGALHRSDLGDDLVSFILRHTEGNPFLVMQLLRTMTEEGVFTYSGTAWQWTIPESLALPVGMSDLVGRRLSRLTPSALRILVTAAAIGRSFPLDLLAAAAPASPEEVLDAVDSGLAASVLTPAEEEGEAYQFAHALLVDAVLRTVSGARQRLIHERIATLLTARAPTALDRIASHYARSGNADQAYTWCRSAAAHAIEVYALDDATDFLGRALSHAATEEQRLAVYDELARAAELAGRWADVQRWSDTMLEAPLVARRPERMLPVQLRRLHAQVRLGSSARETRDGCRDLLAIAERIGSVADVVQTRLLLVQTLARMGDLDEALRIGSDALALAERTENDALVNEALHRLAITYSTVEPARGVALLARLTERARARGDRALEARVAVTLGVTRTRLRDHRGGTTAFRHALELARTVQALEVAAVASMNLGVSELRTGELGAAHAALSDALRLYTTLRNNANRLLAVYNLAHLERERGDMAAAAVLYGETAALAEQFGTLDVAIGALAGRGGAALRMGDVAAAQQWCDRALALLPAGRDWWFQGRELVESLVVRLAVLSGEVERATGRFLTALKGLEPVDAYAAAFLVADCAAELAPRAPTIWSVVERVGAGEIVADFPPLAARFTALRDLAARRDTRTRSARGRGPSAAPEGAALVASPSAMCN